MAGAGNDRIYVYNSFQDWATSGPSVQGGAGDDYVEAYSVNSDVTLHGSADHVPLLRRMLEDGAASLRAYSRDPSTRLPASRRLAFRELGLAIGLHAIERVRAQWSGRDVLAPAVRAIDSFLDRAATIESTWADPSSRRDRGWRDHADINTVMLATSLAPDGYLGLPRL